MAYLLDCERISETVVPKLMEEIVTLRQKVSALTKAATKKVKRAKGWKLKIPKVVFELSALFGDKIATISYDVVDYQVAPDPAKRLRRMRHRNAVMRGLSEANESDCSSAETEQLTGKVLPFMSPRE